MGEIVNLNKFRKQQRRLEEAKTAADNRARFGRTKADRSKTRAERDRDARNLDDKRLD